MSIYKDGKLIAGGRQCMPLLSFVWADHVLNDASWLRADTFSWQSGAVYQAAYQHLADDYNALIEPWVFVYATTTNIGKYCRYPALDKPGTTNQYAYTEYTGNTSYPIVYSPYNTEAGATTPDLYDSPTSSTIIGRINGYETYFSVARPTWDIVGQNKTQYYQAADGHKICPASQESNVTAIYNATGVAWYYIIDTVNERFKLPRAKHNKYADSLGVVGNGISPEFVNLDNNTKIGDNLRAYTNQYSGNNVLYLAGTINSTTNAGLTTDPTKSGIIAQQEQDTDQYKYLYFYVGNFTQTALENTAGLNTELFNGKADLSTVAHVVTEFQEPTAANNYTWYRKYADGWVEQGGVSVYTSDADYTVSLPIEMTDTNYTVLTTVAPLSSPYTGQVGVNRLSAFNLTTTSFKLHGDTAATMQRHCWQVSGMAA